MGDDSVILTPDGLVVNCPRLPEQVVEEKSGNEKDVGFHHLEKVRSAWGSTAGAGSDFFHVYRKQRARELARQEQMDKEWDEAESSRQFQAIRTARIKASLEKQRKNAEQRKRRKINRQIRLAQIGHEQRMAEEPPKQEVPAPPEEPQESPEEPHVEKPETVAEEQTPINPHIHIPTVVEFDEL